MKKTIGLLTAVLLTLSLCPMSALAAQEPTAVRIVVNSELIRFPDAQPFTDPSGNVLVPVRIIGEKLGAQVDWDEADNTVTIQYRSDTIAITFTGDRRTASVTRNDVPVAQDIAPFIKDGRTYVSLHFLNGLTGCQTQWNLRLGTAFVTLPDSSQQSAAENGQPATTSEILNIKSFDGYTLAGKLDLPTGSAAVSTLVVFVPGTGPNTYDNRRLLGNTEFNYYDLFAQELGKRQVGFFRYNTRGVEEGTEPPMYDKINADDYKKYTPQNQVKDIECMITELKKNDRLKNAKIVLLGWSEGTMIAPLVAERNNVAISSLMLAGYCNEKMQDIIEWQLSGESTMIFMYEYFDANLDGTITRQEYEADPAGIVKSSLGGATFEQLDIDKDGNITSADIAVLQAGRKKLVLDAIANRDDKWIWDNYFQITSEWLDGHALLEASKDVVPKLDIPVNIFHGVYDLNVPVQGSFGVYDACLAEGKTNLRVYVFDGNDHDLNYLLYPLKNIIPEGLTRIFDECAKVK